MNMTRTLLAGLFVLGVAASALAVETPRQAPDDGRIRFVDYQPFNVVRIVAALRSSVQIEFAADEDIAHAALGNTVAWEIAPAGNILFLKPRESQPATNLSVVTTRRDGSGFIFLVGLLFKEVLAVGSPASIKPIEKTKAI